MNPSPNPTGLTATQVEAARVRDGWNELAADRSHGVLHTLIGVVREPMFLLLLGAGAIYLLMGDPHEALVLLGFVLVIIGVTVLQERRTERALAALRDLSSPRALVLREGEVQRVAGREVVRGDILLLNEGDRVPADGTVLSAHELAIDESMLTGESVAVSKLIDDGAPALQVFAGTLVVRGQGTVEVSATGSATELGRIGTSLRDISTGASPLQSRTGPAGAAPGADRRRAVRAAGAAARAVARRLARRSAGRHHAGDGHPAAGVSGHPHRVPRIRCATHRCARRADAPAGGDRNAGADHGAVRRQDRHPDAQPHGGGRADRGR
jgi:hypothetical protein